MIAESERQSRCRHRT